MRARAVTLTRLLPDAYVRLLANWGLALAGIEAVIEPPRRSEGLAPTAREDE